MPRVHSQGTPTLVAEKRCDLYSATIELSKLHPLLTDFRMNFDQENLHFSNFHSYTLEIPRFCF